MSNAHQFRQYAGLCWGLPIQNRKIELRAMDASWHRIGLRLDVAARRESPPRYSAVTTGHLSPTPTVTDQRHEPPVHFCLLPPSHLPVSVRLRSLARLSLCGL